VIKDTQSAPRKKWRYVGTISIFMIADGIGKIVHQRDFGWIVALGGAISLVAWTIKILRDQ